MVDSDRLVAAYETARCDLLAESPTAGHWVGSLSSSPQATAAAVSALAIVERHTLLTGRPNDLRECAIGEVIVASLRWLAKHQNADGGWGDSDRSASNLPATMLARAAFALTCVPADHPGLLERADAYLAAHGGLKGVKHDCAEDETLLAGVLVSGALAGLLSWNQVPVARFELDALADRLRQHWRGATLDWHSAVQTAVGQARFSHRPPRNPLVRVIRKLSRAASVRRIANLQATNGGFLDAVLPTSIIVMSLASSGQAEHPLVRRGLDFLIECVRGDASWPVQAEMPVRDTATVIEAFDRAREDLRGEPAIDWLLRVQQSASEHTSGQGWSWSDNPAAVANTLDTSAALGALEAAWRADVSAQTRLVPAAMAGVRWLLAAQNVDGGWPALMPGSEASSLVASATDTTAKALSALAAWRGKLKQSTTLSELTREVLDAGISRAVAAGRLYLLARQQPNGSWLPTWYGNEQRADRRNPVIGTALVLQALSDLEQLADLSPRRGLDWLASVQHADGSFGGDVECDLQRGCGLATVEETARAVEALQACGCAQAHDEAVRKGLSWLIDRVEANAHHQAAPLEISLSNAWYYNPLEPLARTVAALGLAVRQMIPDRAPRSLAHTGKT